MYEMRYSIYCLVVLVFFLGGCKSKTQPSPPVEEVSSKIYQPSLSKVSVPLILKVSELEKTLNLKLRGILYEDNSYTNNDNDNLKVMIIKNGQIKLGAKDEFIIYEVPLKCMVKGRQPMLFTELTAKTDFEINLKFQTKLDVDQKWNLTTSTKSLGYKLLNDPELDFGVTSLPLKGVVGVLLDNFLDDMASIVDDQIKENFDTRKYVSDMWKEMQEPILLDEEYNSWMKVTPKYFAYSPFKGNNHHISLNIGLNAYFEVITGRRPDFEVNNELPDLIKIDKLPEEYFISLKTELYYDKMNEILQESFVGYEYEYVGKKKIIVTDALIYGNGERLVVKVTFAGNMKGDFYMTGIPKFDESTKSVYIDDFDFDIESKAFVLKAAEWLLHSSFNKQINKYLKFSLQEQIDDSMKMFEEYLKESQLDETIGVECKIDEAILNDVILNDESMNTILDLTGSLKINYGK